MSEEQLIKTPGVFGENGNFLLERELGSGGMGGVYMGRDKMLERPVAVKVMLKQYGSDPAFVEKFKKEAQAAARLIHPNIAQVYSYGISDGMPYIAMELVAGGSLDGLMKVHGTSIDVPRVMKICEQVAQALRCAADQGLVHGDVKPENVLLDANGNAKLVDFGLAAMQTDTNEIWGTPYYIAPEKVKKEPVDYRADMYSLGGTIYHALTGVAPFEGDDATSVVRKRFEGAPKKPSEVRPGLSPQIDFLVMKMLALNPQDRYPSFEALLADFKKVMTTGLSGTQSVAAAAMMGASMPTARATTRTAMGGGKKLMIKPKKKFKVGGAEDAEDTSDVAELGGEEGLEGEASAGGRKRTIKRFKTNLRNTEDGEEPEEEGGNIGVKVALVIGGVILAIGAVIGGLYGLKVMNDSGNAKAVQERLSKNYNAAIQNYGLLSEEVDKFKDRLDREIVEATNRCQTITASIAKQMKGVYPADYIDQLKPGKTPALLKAERLLLPPKEPQETPAAEGEKPADGAPVAAAATPAAPAAPQFQRKRFRAPVDDEADPASPLGKRYLKEKAEFEKQQEAEIAAAKTKAAEAESEQKKPAVSEDGTPVRDKPDFVDKMADLWCSVYDAQAAKIEVCLELDAIRAEIDNNRLDPNQELTDALVQQVGATQEEITTRFKALKTDERVTKVIEKIGTAVNSKGNRAEASCKDRTRAIRQEERKAAAEKAQKEKDKKKDEDEKARKEKHREDELAAAKALYDEICEGEVKTLSWEEAIKRLEDLKATFENDPFNSGEGVVLLDKSLKSVRRMAKVQEILQRNVKDYKFKNKLPKDATVSSITGYTITEASEKGLVLMPPKGKKTRNLTWRLLYRNYHSNLCELFNRFIWHAGKNGAPKLSTLERADAMIGIALTLQTVCSDDTSASEFAQKVVLDAVKEFPAIRDDAKELFPTIDFSSIEAEE